MLFESLFRHADQQPHQPAVVDDTGTYTWQQYAAAAAGLGMYLSFQTDRTRVGLLLPASMGFAASFYGTLLAGKTVVPINFLLGDREVQHIIADSGIDTIVSMSLSLMMCCTSRSPSRKLIGTTVLPASSVP